MIDPYNHGGRKVREIVRTSDDQQAEAERILRDAPPIALAETDDTSTRAILEALMSQRSTFKGNTK